MISIHFREILRIYGHCLGIITTFCYRQDSNVVSVKFFENSLVSE